MEAANNQNRKRTRDDNPAEIMVETKKQESYNVEQRRYEFYDGIGVFDFPWLKEGVVFSAEDDDHEQDKFAPCSYLDADHDNFNIQSQNNYDMDDDDDDDHHSLWPLMLDDLDCIWSCVIDHPLDVDLGLPFNKGSYHI